jgi:membrane protein
MTNRRSGSPGPQNIGARAWGFVARATVRKFADDGGGDIAAALTFHASLALVPSLLVGVSVISLLGTDSTAVAFALEIVRAVAPEDTAATIGRAVDSLAESALGGPVLVLAAGLTIWAIARYIAVLGRGMNRVYEVEEGRSPWALKSMQIGVAIVVILASAASVGVAAASASVAAAIGAELGVGEAGLTAWRIVRWPILVAIVIATVAFLYDRAPNIRHPRFRWLSWGASLAIAVLALASLAFGFWVSGIADYERVYGPLAGIIVLLLWLWIANLALVLGVEFDATLERARELQEGEPAEARPRLPVRDRSRIVRKQARRSTEIAEARRLRDHP